MPFTPALKKAIVNHYFREAVSPFGQPPYLALFIDTTASIEDGGVNITCTAALGAAEVVISGLKAGATILQNTMVIFSNDLTSVYFVRSDCTGSQDLKIHPPLKELLNNATLSYMTEAAWPYYERLKVAFSYPNDHGAASLLDDMKFEKVTGLDPNETRHARALAIFNQKPAGGVMLCFTVAVLPKQLGNNDSFLVPAGAGNIDWAGY